MERYWFFNSATGDTRTYQASDFADYFGNVLSTGLLHTDEVPAMEVKCDGTDLRTYVEPGRAIMKGYAYENTTDLYLDHDIPEPDSDRIDRIVLRLDTTNENRYIRLFVLTGTPASSPTPPALTRDEFVHEMSLAHITVRANTSALDPVDLVDERLDEQLCGLVHSLISIPTSQFQDQWDAWFDENTSSFEQQFLDWFGSVQGDWTEWFNGTQNEWETWFSEKQSQSDVSQADFDNHLGNEMPHKFEDNGTIYKWGMKAENGVAILVFEEEV